MTGVQTCALPISYPDPSSPTGEGTFDGIVLSDFSYARSSGYLEVTLYFRNDLFVQTTASQTNDIEICIGARHNATENEDDNGGTYRAWAGRNDILARWDKETNLYWGVAARVPNCNKTPDVNRDGILDPVLCSWGTTTLADGYDYRTATLLVPYDLDIQFKG